MAYGQRVYAFSAHHKQFTPVRCCIKSRCELRRLDQVVLQCTHHEWSSVTSPGLLIIGLSSLTSWQEVMQAVMLPYMTFPVVIVPVLLMCCRRQSIEVRKSALPNITLATLPRPEVHSTHNYCNCPFLFWLALC